MKLFTRHLIFTLSVIIFFSVSANSFSDECTGISIRFPERAATGLTYDPSSGKAKLTDNPTLTVTTAPGIRIVSNVIMEFKQNSDVVLSFTMPTTGIGSSSATATLPCTQPNHLAPLIENANDISSESMNFKVTVKNADTGARSLCVREGVPTSLTRTNAACPRMKGVGSQ